MKRHSCLSDQLTNYVSFVCKLSFIYNEFAISLSNFIEQYSVDHHFKKLQSKHKCQSSAYICQVMLRVLEAVAQEVKMYSNLGTYLEKEVAKGLNDLRKDWLVELERIEKKSANIKNIVFSTVENFLEVRENVFQMENKREFYENLQGLNTPSFFTTKTTFPHLLAPNLHVHNNYVVHLSFLDGVLDSFNNQLRPEIIKQLNEVQDFATKGVSSILNQQLLFLSEKHFVGYQKDKEQTNNVTELNATHSCMHKPYENISGKMKLEISLPPSLQPFNDKMKKVICNEETQPQLEDKVKHLSITNSDTGLKSSLERLENGGKIAMMRILTKALEDYEYLKKTRCQAEKKNLQDPECEKKLSVDNKNNGNEKEIGNDSNFKIKISSLKEEKVKPKNEIKIKSKSNSDNDLSKSHSDSEKAERLEESLVDKVVPDQKNETMKREGKSEQERNFKNYAKLYICDENSSDVLTKSTTIMVFSNKTSKETKRVSFMQQRSYSCGDLSPSDHEEEWLKGQKKDEDLLEECQNNDNLYFTPQGKISPNPYQLHNFPAKSKQFSCSFSKRQAYYKEHVYNEKKSKRMMNEAENNHEWRTRRQHWQKQRSKSSDLSWNTGMWSPVEEKNRVLIIVTSSKKHNFQEDRNKMKLPAFFQMDSGSSYESTEHHESNKIPVEKTKSQNSFCQTNSTSPFPYHPMNYPAQLHQPQKYNTDRLSPFYNPMYENNQLLSPRYHDHCPRKPFSDHKRNRESWTMHNMKSHSFDSSFDDHNNRINISTALSGPSLNQAAYKSHYSSKQMMLSGSERRRRFVQQVDRSLERKDLLPSPGHLFHAYNQISKHRDKRPLRPADVLSRETSERLRISNEEIKNMRLKEKSPEANLKQNRIILSPRTRNALISDSKRSTFSQQKSFSYDVPSMQPKTDIPLRKQSEPTVGSFNSTIPKNKFIHDYTGSTKLTRSPQLYPQFTLQTPYYREHVPRSFHPLQLQMVQQPSIERLYSPNSCYNSPRFSFSNKRKVYCTQRSQSCETSNRASVDMNRPSVSEQALTNSSFSKRDYLNLNEMKDFQCHFNEPSKILIRHPCSTSNLLNKRSNFSYQKSQSCENNNTLYVPTNNPIKTSPREIKNLLGYPRLLRQFAKSDIEVEPIYEKDSSNSSKDAPDVIKSDEEKTSSIKSFQIPNQKDETSLGNQGSSRGNKTLVKINVKQTDVPRVSDTNKYFFKTENLKKSSEVVQQPYIQYKNSLQDREFMKSSNKKTVEDSKRKIEKVEKANVIPEKEVSDGIVRWRRKMPEISSIEAYEKFERFMMKNKSWVVDKRTNFQKNEKGNKRLIFSQQKSVSCKENESDGNNLKVSCAEKRKEMAYQKKKSYSLDEYVPQTDVKNRASENHQKMTVHQLFDAFNHNPEQSYKKTYNKSNTLRKSTYTSQEVKNLSKVNQLKYEERKKMKTSSSKKLNMMHDVKPVNEGDELEGNKKEEKAIHKNTMTCKLPIARIFAKLKFERPKK